MSDDTTAGAGTTNVTIGQNGTRADISVTGMDRDGPTEEIVTLTLSGETDGTGSLSIDAASVLPPTGAPYLTAERGDVEVVVGESNTAPDESVPMAIGLLGGTIVILGSFILLRRRTQT